MAELVDAPVTKKAKTAKSAKIPSSIIINFANNEEVNAGPPIDVPVESTAKQLDLLINSLLSNEEPLPYAFYINDVEVITSIKDTLEELHQAATNSNSGNDGKAAVQSFEETMVVHYQPLSLFRVRPVTRCIETMPGHTDAVLHVSYSADGQRLASGGGDMAVRFWNVVTSMPQHTCHGHKHHVLCTGWSPDGVIFASADRSGEVRLWNPITGIQRGQPLRGHRKWVTSLAFEPLHAGLATIPTGKTTTTTTTTTTQGDTGRKGAEIDAEVGMLCTRMASSSKDHTVKIWNLVSGICETTISGHSDSVECVKWGGTGLLYTCSRDRTIKVWAIDGHGRSQQKLVRTLCGHAHRINSLALNCDYIMRTGAYELGAERRTVQQQQQQQQQQTAAGADPTNLVVPDNTGKYTGTLTADLRERALARYTALIGAEGERLVSGSDDFTLFMWRPQVDKSPVSRLTGHQQLVNQIAFSPDSRYVASASFDKKVKLWCGRTGRFLATLHGHVGSVYQVSWSADSNFLASASKDSTVKVWAVRNPKKAAYTLAGHEDEVYSLDWSPNGSQLASGSKDRTIKIWHH